MMARIAIPLALAVLTAGAMADALVLDGVWQAKRHAGPDLRGPLWIDRGTADIAGRRAPVVRHDGHVSIAFGDGAFAGEMAGSTISGFWTQAPTSSGSRYLTPVTLRRTAAGVWRGEVRPLDDALTLYLVARKDADGTLGGFLRNPEANIGRFLAFSSIKTDGDAVSLLGPRGAIASGRFDPRTDTLPLSFPGTGMSFDFTRADATSDFYPRRTSEYTYARPMPRSDGWPVAKASDVGVSETALTDFVRMLIGMKDDGIHASNIHAVLVARHGRLVLEEYFHGFSADTLHDLRSASKSITSVLVGAAMQQGEPVGPDTPVYRTMNASATDATKEAMTLRHLLTMSSGLDCDDGDDKSPGNEDTMQSQRADRDWYHYTLSLKSVRPPGAQSVYCSGGANLAAGVLAKASGKPMARLFADLVAAPLGISQYAINTMPSGEAYGGGGMHLYPRDFLKIGQMMLNGGTWRGRRILAADFVRDATAAHFASHGIHYGYLWWVADYPYKDGTVRAYFAGGNGGQVVMVVPKLDLVIEFLGGNYGDAALYIPQRVFVPKYILPAVN